MQLVINAGIKAQFSHCVLAFIWPTGNAHRAATARLGQRGKGAAHRARSRTDHHGVTRFRDDDFDQTIPGGDAGHTDSTQVGTQRYMGGVDLAQRTELGCIHHAVLLPATHAYHLVARREFRVLGFKYLTDGTATHGLAQGLWLGIALGIVHAAAHVRVQAQVVMAHQHLTVLQGRCVAGDQLEVAGQCFTGGTVVEVDLLISGHGEVSRCCYELRSCTRKLHAVYRPICH